ncbi:MULTISPECIES: HAD family hydrolase [Bacillus]|jgi:hydroxymethylpyrimidine pyrophosphatase-like HAD family hydrolase|uniref:HAD family hydrolase n=1 Tax=Bacillus TaxID=1386 RepID=UPI00081FA8BD|nr:MULTISPECIES: HAD family hydrolase [Bacillus]AOC57864.1 hydrolase (had superfamily) [Bacillus pumilus]MBR0588040.1 hydrolase (had superfamily) [Bacillus pumilus DW2J2]MBR0618049.1 hydrolase (had superfamily) [Bacillus pumilus]MBR0621973.1 hydrolase (had superfamily) [Bacillus pumilus]MBR0625368.1 hydrolase (had superfamily) [Bacillus pumilus]
MKTCAFASDLDRTLIYSHRVLDQYEYEGDYDLVEVLDERPLSYMSVETKKSLQTIHQLGWFIPVTTRTTAQYERITFFQQELQPEYAVTTNGGCILHHGKPLEDWQAIVDERLKACMSVREMLRAISDLPVAAWVKRTRTAEGKFLYLIMKDEYLSHIPLAELKLWGEERGWQVSLQGRKLYFIPEPLNKWDAVAFLKERLELEYVYGAGDSLLDAGLIRQADMGFAPRHGEVLDFDPLLEPTAASGMAAADEITACVMKQMTTVKKPSIR